jgi:hypothetical protein
MKPKLFLKIHPAVIAFLISNNEHGIINITTDLNRNINLIQKSLGHLKDYNVDQILIEKPFLKLLGDNQKQIAANIIHIQRLTGALLALLSITFPSSTIEQISARAAREAVYGTEHLTKDQQLSEANVILGNTKEYSALELLALHDCLVLKSFNKQKK